MRYAHELLVLLPSIGLALGIAAAAATWIGFWVATRRYAGRRSFESRDGARRSQRPADQPRDLASPAPVAPPPSSALIEAVALLRELARREARGAGGHARHRLLDRTERFAMAASEMQTHPRLASETTAGRTWSDAYLSLDDHIVSLSQQGRTVKEIARELELPAEDIKVALMALLSHRR